MTWRYGLRHPLGLGLLGASLALALLSMLGGPWRDRELWLALTGVLAYTAVTATVALRRPSGLRTPQSALWMAQSSVASNTAPAQSSDVASDWVHSTEEALRHLREPSALAKCGLILLLPRSLVLAHSTTESSPSALTPMEKAKLLRLVVEASLEKLRLAAGGERAALEYQILHAEYVVGLPNTAIMTRYSIGEGTFHRSRRAGVQALAAELQARESLLA